MKRVLFIFTIAALSVCGCSNNTRYDKNAEMAISRAMERAIELGEKLISEKDLIENVALTQGTDAAVKLHDSIGHRDHVNAFWEKVGQIEELCNQVTDTLAQKEIIAHLYPYAERLEMIIDEIY